MCDASIMLSAKEVAIRDLTSHSTPSGLVYPTAETQQNRIQRSVMAIYNTLAIHFWKSGWQSDVSSHGNDSPVNNLAFLTLIRYIISTQFGRHYEAYRTVCLPPSHHTK